MVKVEDIRIYTSAGGQRKRESNEEEVEENKQDKQNTKSLKNDNNNNNNTKDKKQIEDDIINLIYNSEYFRKRVKKMRSKEQLINDLIKQTDLNQIVILKSGISRKIVADDYICFVVGGEAKNSNVKHFFLSILSILFILLFGIFFFFFFSLFHWRGFTQIRIKCLKNVSILGRTCL